MELLFANHGAANGNKWYVNHIYFVNTGAVIKDRKLRKWSPEPIQTAGMESLCQQKMCGYGEDEIRAGFDNEIYEREIVNKGRTKEMKELQIGELKAGRGEKVSGFVKIEGADFGIPVTLICGAVEGETVLISGGLHNAEYVGIQAAMELADELDPAHVKGNIIIIRLVNRTGFEHRTMSVVYEDGKNLNREFPGSALGTLAERICYTIEHTFLKKADYYIDLHCGDGFEGLVSYVYCVGAAKPEVAAKSREMAEIAHVDYLVESSSGKGGAYNYAGSMGIPSILLERGSNSIWCRDEVEKDKHDVRNILRYLHFLEGEAHRHGHKPIDVSPVVYEDAGHSGCWYPSMQPGETFRKGEILGRICDYFGNELEVCTAKHDGIMLYETVSLCIMKGTPMVAYGMWDVDTMGKIEKECFVCGCEKDHQHMKE